MSDEDRKIPDMFRTEDGKLCQEKIFANPMAFVEWFQKADDKVWVEDSGAADAAQPAEDAAPSDAEATE